MTNTILIYIAIVLSAISLVLQDILKILTTNL